jgi:hypothetical protein
MILYGIKNFHCQVVSHYILGVDQDDLEKNVLLGFLVVVDCAEDLEEAQHEEKGM